MIPVTRWWLVCHAPLVDPWSDRIVGRSDVDADLSFDPEPLQRILPEKAQWVVSTARRCQQSAWRLGADHDRWQVVREFVEQDMGEWEGRTWDEVLTNDRRALAYVEGFQRLRPPGGESLDDMRKRCGMAFERLITRLEGPEIIAVLDPGPIRCLLSTVLGVTIPSAQKLAIDPLSISGMARKRSHWQVLGINWIR